MLDYRLKRCVFNEARCICQAKRSGKSIFILLVNILFYAGRTTTFHVISTKPGAQETSFVGKSLLAPHDSIFSLIESLCLPVLAMVQRFLQLFRLAYLL